MGGQAWPDMSRRGHTQDAVHNGPRLPSRDSKPSIDELPPRHRSLARPMLHVVTSADGRLCNARFGFSCLRGLTLQTAAAPRYISRLRSPPSPPSSLHGSILRLPSATIKQPSASPTSSPSIILLSPPHPISIASIRARSADDGVADISSQSQRFSPMPKKNYKKKKR